MASELNLQPYNLVRPTKIRWVFPQTDDIFSVMKSSSMVKFLKKSEAALTNDHITYEYKLLDEAAYSNWLSFYEQEMRANNFEVIANQEWYHKKISEGKVVEGFFFYQNNTLVGTGIITRKELELAVFAFKASHHIKLTGEPNSSLGAIIDFLFIKKMHELGVKTISAGRSRNAYGVINTFGYVDYKLRFGYEPQPDWDSGRETTVPLNEEGLVIFYGQKDTQLGLYLARPKGSTFTTDLARFSTDQIPFSIIEY